MNKKKCTLCGFPTFRQKNAIYCNCCAKLVRKATAAKARRSDSKIRRELHELGNVIEGVMEEWSYGR